MYVHIIIIVFLNALQCVVHVGTVHVRMPTGKMYVCLYMYVLHVSHAAVVELQF